MWTGDLETAIEHLENALRLSPRARVGHSQSLMGMAYFLRKRFDQALPNLVLAIQQDPADPVPYRYLAACYAHTGRLADAREIVARLQTITSAVIPTALHLRNPEHQRLFLSGLRLAMGDAN
jgi:adenylate cyclase